MIEKIETPIEIRIPVKTIKDYGLELVHDLTGQPRNYLHLVGIRGADNVGKKYLHDAGYHILIGFKIGKTQWWEYTKRFPLSVGKWTEEKPIN